MLISGLDNHGYIFKLVKIKVPYRKDYNDRANLGCFGLDLAI
jgi:hypothetical protein